MIDIEFAEKEFANYASKYIDGNDKIIYKIQHTKRVQDFAKKISESLNLEEENIKLAILIALLHDIGRFEQIKRYNSFNDVTTVDHADLGVQILFTNNYIRKYIATDKYDSVIYKAIKNHNKFEIEENLNYTELLHSKIIRDADKIDILNEVCKRPFETVCNEADISNQNLSDKIYEDIMNKNVVNVKEAQTDLDRWILKIGFIFDINFKYSLNVIRENKTIFKFIDRIHTDRKDTNEKLQNIRKLIDSYFTD